MSLPTFTIDSSYNLTTNAPAILGSSYSGVVYCGSLSYDMAIIIDSKLAIVHSQVLPNLNPITVSPDPAKQVYHIFKNTSSPNTRVVLAESWILSALKIAAVTVSATITLTQGDLITTQALRSLLSGYPSIISAFTLSDPY